MTATVTNLLERRTRRQEPAMTFETDHEALLFAAACVADLRETALAGDLTTEHLALKLEQAADVIRACIRLHADESETR